MKPTEYANKEKARLEELIKEKTSDLKYIESIAESLDKKSDKIDIDIISPSFLYGSVATVRLTVGSSLELLDLIRLLAPEPMCNFTFSCNQLMLESYAHKHILKDKELPANYIEFEGVFIEADQFDTSVVWWTMLDQVCVRIEVKVHGPNYFDKSLREQFAVVRKSERWHRNDVVVEYLEGGTVPKSIDAKRVAVQGGRRYYLFYTLEGFFDYVHELWSKADE